ncbi:MAG TPA: DNA mismatch repair endonuclease MutL [Thermoanaerobaculia bacterium]|nr:DNA mismatch repair endonuclease MutL [Thermoanaerobaculia bacterium]
MPRIHVLPDVLVNQIAAGEVVERPSSVVKELVENALDAGATRVTVDVEGGGAARIEVADDGSGMGPEDARLALERHATSKISGADDLARIGTLGFRGEALPSIASVSRLVLSTSPDGSGLGTEVVCDAGAPPVVRPARQTKGTRVVVENLFANVPARRKFLKSADAELRAIVRTFTALSLARPAVAFVLRSGPRLLLDLPAAADALGRFRDVLGGAFEGTLVPVSFAHRGLQLSGAVTPPRTTFPSKTQQWLFVNGRAVKDATASHAAQLAARETLRTDRHPAFALFVACAPDACDVNVHPQKLEVRFRDPSAVHSLVHRGLLVALGGAGGATGVEAEALVAPAPWALRRAGPAVRSAASMAETLEAWGGALAPTAAADVARSAYPEGDVAESPVGALRLLGQYRDSFLVAEGERGLVLIDQHVAHERVRYERILDRLEASRASSQSLLLPVTFEATAEEALELARAEGLLEAAGFLVSERSGRSFVVSATPADTPAGAVVPFLREVLGRLAALPEGGEAGLARRREALAASLACHGAVTVNTRLAPAEASKLLSDLARCRDPWTCPHGRPILLAFDHAELEKRFGRRT